MLIMGVITVSDGIRGFRFVFDERDNSDKPFMNSLYNDNNLIAGTLDM